MKLSWKAVVPLALTAALLLLPAPEGLAPHAWRYFAVFAGVVAALVLEPLPGGAVGLVGVVVVALGAPWLLFGPAELARPGFRTETAALAWALSGFANGTVWLIFGAFMFALGYERTGLGRRLALLLVRRLGGSTLSLGYAVALADLALAPFTPSNTARSGGTIYPVVRNLPPLYDSLPDTPSARRLGSYLMWTAFATTCVTSSMFLTALAPNLLALELARKATGAAPGWGEWFVAFLPVGLLLFLAVPWVTYRLYPPEVKAAPAVRDWAAAELAKLGPVSRRELQLAALVGAALALWVAGGTWVNPTLVALAVIAGLLVLGVLTWEDVVTNKAAWSTLAWFATLVALADGLNRTGFVGWVGAGAGAALQGAPPALVGLGLLALFYFSHYLFASTTAHATALLPVMLATATAVPGLDGPTFALQLCLTLGLMGVVSPYATGPSPIYAGSGYLPARDFWRLGGIFGALFFAVFVLVGLPWMAWVR